MRISELGDLFPRNCVLPDTYSMSVTVQQEIQKQYEFIDFVSKERKNQEDAASNSLVAILRARQRIEVLKVPTIKELALDHLNSGLSVVIFVNFKDTLNILATELNVDCLIHGDQTMDERDKAVEDFQSNRKTIIICNIKSGGVGISLHDTAGDHPRVSIISPTWSAQDLVQALGRIHRAEGKTPCIQKIVYCAGTIEDSVCSNLQEKLFNYMRINDWKNQTMHNF